MIPPSRAAPPMTQEAPIEAAAEEALHEANMYAAPQVRSAIIAAVTPLIRAAALEEAAKVGENHAWGGYQVAAVIRALKVS